MITGFYAGLLGLWLAFLLLRVVRLRWKYKVGAGDGGQKELTQALRVHGNFIETVPFILILMGLLEAQAVLPAPVLHAFGVTLALSRLLHWHGLSRTLGPSKGRLLGTVLMLAALLGAALALLYNFIAG